MRERRSVPAAGLSFLIILALISALGPFSIDMYLPAMPQMANALNASPAMLQLTITGYLLGVAVGPLVLAPLADAKGRKPVMALFLALYGVASAGCALAQSAEMLVMLRVAQAVAGGAAMAVSRAMLADVYEGDALSRASSILMTVFTIAPVVAPLFGAWLLELGSWRWIFWALVGVAGVSVGLLQLLPETLPKDRRRPYNLPSVLGSYGEILANPHGRRYLASTFAFAFMFFAMLSASPFIFIDHFGATPSEFAVYFAAISGAAIISNIMNARIVFRVGYERMLRGATWGLVVLAMVMGVVTLTEFGGVWGVFGVMFWLMGLFHISIANTMAGLMRAVGRGAGAASATLAFARFIGGALGTVMVGAFNTSAPWPFALVIGVAAVGAVLSLRLGQSRASRSVNNP
ncbi:MAG: multidrug effflux MFS transporter [Pseudomonadota bacterium]